MARTGRPPVPTNLKILNGNPGKRPLNLDEPKYDIKVPKFPENLAEEAGEEWKRITRLLKSSRIITEADRAALTGYCVNWARWLDAERHLAAEGVLVKHKAPEPSTYEYLEVNDYLKISEKALQGMSKFLSEFGLTPAARVRLKAPPKDSGDDLDKKMFG